MVTPRNRLIPEWPAPTRVRACTTLRTGGYSAAPYDGFNLAQHVGEDPNTVSLNRALLKQQAQLPGDPLWLTQVHGTAVVDAANTTGSVEADASYTERSGVVCAVLTADCLPILLCNRQGSRVAAIHAGWRGLAAGVIDATLAAWGEHNPEEILVWLGPAIGPAAFEVSQDVLDGFQQQGFQTNDDLFKPLPKKGQFLADLYGLAKQRLQQFGIAEHAIFGGNYCTVSDPKRFYSHRRENPTGRMASLIWLA